MSTYAITDIFIPDEDKEVDASYFLNRNEDELFEIRRKTRPKVNELSLLCSTCYQPLLLAGTKEQTFYFRHWKDSDDCPIKTTCSLTYEQMLAIKYNGQKEGRRHKENKNLLADLLRKDTAFEDVCVEKTFREENPTGVAKSWRRPDVSATYIDKGVKVAFELQVSTTFIDVIIDRENFYKSNNAFIAWIFLEFEASKFTELDIAYANRGNALVFDKEAIDASKQAGELMLKCYYKKPEVIENRDSVEVEDYWCFTMVSIKDLKFDHDEGKLFLFDYKQLRKEAALQAQKIRDEIRKRKEAEKLKEAIRLHKLQEKQLKERVNDRPTIRRSPPANRRQHLKDRFSKRTFDALERSNGLDSLYCPKCDNRDHFYNKACFIYCDICKSEIKY